MPKKSSPRKKLVKKLDTIVSLYIRARDGKCIVCGKKENLQNGHLFTRSAYSTRWDEVNCNAQCAGCNLRHEFDSYPYTAKFMDKYGNKEYHALHIRYARAKRYSDKELEQLYEYFKEKYRLCNGLS